MTAHESEFLHTDPKPIDMLLFCPECGMQHIDAPEPEREIYVDGAQGTATIRGWNNPPHKSHLCANCKCVWRQCDFPTNGVASIQTRGKDDTWPRTQNAEREADEFPAGVGAALRDTWQNGQVWQTRLLELGDESPWVPVADNGLHEPAWDHQQEYRRIR